MRAREAAADGATPPPPQAAPATQNTQGARRIEVRLALSSTAADALGELRVRRLFEIELDDIGSLAPGSDGPLGDHVAHVWVDRPSPSQVLIEARLAERAVTRRYITIAGLNADVAARLVAITANELVRALARPSRPRKPPAPRVPTAKEIEESQRRAPTIVWSVSPNFMFVPSISGTLGGVGVSLGFRGLGASERLFANWSQGPSDGGQTRLLELGLALDYRVRLSRSVRLALGAQTSFDFIKLSSARAVDGMIGDDSTWTGRAGGLFGIDVRALGPTWIGLHLSPSALLRDARFVDQNGQNSALSGFFLGVEVALQVEHSLLGSRSTNGR